MLRDAPLTSEEANARVKRLRRLKLPDEVHIGKMSWSEFVTKFVIEWANKYPTLYAHNDREQTSAGKRRSLGDITKLCQYYYPDQGISLESVKNHLKKLVNDSMISTDICSTIHKRVFFYRSNRSQTIDEVDDRDEFGWKFNLEKKTRVPKGKILY
jgi:hypothetical protein